MFLILFLIATTFRSWVIY